ncbi:hypothetical protein Igag_0756 [Ignisphaera aggregans DSM 17230]|uniref:Uncharacterized protein n=1 Tax=Ignisphaera aggregans (strain DSM 17230 / JCM 13409 / AQ1.S1) TaxID=583356 RepID=E0STA7_IGNAA|nr:hypothetical protein Igag_0756 [Ignisphaera aggregans DSM 17230]
MSIVEVRLVNEYDDIPARALRIKHVKGSLETPVYAVSVTDIDQKLIKREDLKGVVEVYIPLRLEKLEDMNRALELEQQFEYRVNSYMRKAPYDQLIVVVPLVEGVQGRELSVDDASSYGKYIAELVVNSRADIVCTPIFYRIAEKYIDILVERFLDTMTAYSIGVALSIPYTSRETREKLINIYLNTVNRNSRALLNFLCVDYNSSNPIYRYTLHNYVLGYVKELQEEIDEPVAIYGVNVKYNRVAKKYDELPARDLVSYFVQLDIFGGNHKRRPIPGEVAERLRAGESIWKQKLLNRNRYTYISLDRMTKELELAIPEAKLVEKLIAEGFNRSYVEKIVKHINIRNILSEVDILRPLFSGHGWQHFENPTQYLNSKEIVKIDNALLKNLKSYTEILKPKTKKLDKYLN